MPFIIMILLHEEELLDETVLLELLGEQADVGVHVLAELLVEVFLRRVFQLRQREHYLEQVQLAYLLVVVRVKKVESNLQQQTPVFDQLLNLVLELVEVDGRRECQNNVQFLREDRAVLRIEKCFELLLAQTVAVTAGDQHEVLF